MRTSRPIQLTSERRIIAGLAAATVLFIFVTVASLASIRRLETDVASVRHTEEVIAKAQTVLSHIIDAESAGRGFSLTGDTTFLDPYTVAASQLASEVSELQLLVVDNPPQLHRSLAIQQRVMERLSLVAHLIKVRSDEGLVAAQREVSSRRGKDVQDAIRQRIDEFIAAERALFVERTEATHRSTLRATIAAGAGTALSIIMFLVAAGLVVRDYRRSHRAHARVSADNLALNDHIQKAQTALSNARSRLHMTDAAFQNAQEGLVVTGSDGLILSVNRAFIRITEFSEEECVGQSMSQHRSDRHGDDFYQAMWQQLQAQGEWAGAIWNKRRGGETYQAWLSINAVRDTAGAVQNYIGVLTDMSRMQRVETDLERLALHDALTGLPNRSLLKSRLAQALEQARLDGTHCAVLYQDLDRFKAVNDTLGHAAGDTLLREVARRIQSQLRDGDTVARLGGDEFVILLKGLSQPGAAGKVAQKIITALNETFDLDGQPANIGASVGISISGIDGSTGDELLAKADAALYEAKRGGRNTWRSASPLDAAQPMH
ncbi:MAG: diguanylate cyclase [Moraxellaceae bacterium]|nr:diguanylate cyclase [Moraxellaceae bacterium]